jgi:tetraacyldisaccharide 4'-kinase
MKLDNPYLLFKNKNLLFWVSLPVLYVLSLVYALVVTVLKFLYRMRLLPSYRPECKVISVGNITVGGTGKTPLVEWIAELLRENGMKPGIIIRGYKKPKSKNADVIAKSNRYFDIGDEACMLKDNLVDVSIAIGRDKIKSAMELEKLGNRPLILDDGFQHWRLRRDLDIVAVDCSYAFRNQMLLPLGRLREPLSSLKRADIFVLTKTDFSAENTEKTRAALLKINPKALVVTSIYQPQCFHDLKEGEDLPIDSASLKKEPVFILAGIASPIYFDKLISSIKLKIKRELVYPDHYEYSSKDLDFIRIMAREMNVNTIITTQKDAARIRHLFTYSENLRIYYLKIKLKVTQNEEEFRNRILSV